MPLTKPLARKFLPALLLCFAMSGLFCSTIEASGVFSVAVKMAKNGQYDRAIELFEALYKRGDNNPNLLYNLATCHYRLGHMLEAHEYFSQLLTDEKFQALAAYNMGLIEAKLGDDVAAIRSFQLSLRTSKADNLALINLNRKALRVISKRNGSYRGGLNKPWYASLSFSLAQDSNAQLLGNELLQTSNSNKSDSVFSSLLTAQTFFAGDRKNGFKIGTFYNTLRYKTVDADSAIYSIFLNRIDSFWQNSKGELAVEAGRQNYLEYHDAYYSAKYLIKTQINQNNRSEFSYRYQWIEPEIKTQYWRGSTQELKTRISLGELGNSVSLTVAYSRNHRLDKIDVDPISFSPVRVGYNLAYHYKKLKHEYGFAFDYRISRFLGDTYDTLDINGVPTQIIIQRNDRKKALNAYYRYAINRKYQWSLNYYRQINQSNRSLSSYQQTVIGSELYILF